MLYCKLWTILAHWYHAFNTYHFSNNISIFQLFRKETVIMSIKHAKLSLFCCHCWWQRFFIWMYSQFCCEIRQLWWKKIIKLIKIKSNSIKFLMKEIYVLLFNLRQVILIPSFHIANMFCCGHSISSITFIQWPLSHGRFSAL